MAAHDDPALERIVVPRTHELAENFEVRRALPSRERRMVGPFVFLDQMGPAVLGAGRGLDVRPHPHIGLSTLTWLLDGEIVHRDSLGVVQPIRPGEVNWMTAGRGIVHSERTGDEARRTGHRLFGLQYWVALPQAREDRAPSFTHHRADELPREEGEGVTACVVAGEFLGKRSPVPTFSPLVCADIRLAPGARIAVPALYPEQALYVAEGRLDLGRDGVHEAGRLLVLREGASVDLRGTGHGDTRVMLIGGEPMDGPRYLSWNFVASSVERIEQAEDDWRQQRFPAVPGETEFIPLPARAGRPVRYP